MQKPINIIGAGLTGLLAASHFQEAMIWERQDRSNFRKHEAVLRFRSSQIGDHLGIEFKKVKVRKGIWHDNRFIEPNIAICNMYSQKVSGIITERSICNIKDEDRWIAPVDLHERLLDRYSNRIHFGKSIESTDGNIISTAPLLETLSSQENDYGVKFEFIKKPITVFKYKVKKSFAYQTIYYPYLNNLNREMSNREKLYRATLNGDILIIECIDKMSVHDFCISSNCFEQVLKSFGINRFDCERIGAYEQNYGKIQPIDDYERKMLLHRLTVEFGIYSLGRFAIWKNILLDDVFQDIQVIKKLMQMNSKYELLKNF